MDPDSWRWLLLALILCANGVVSSFEPPTVPAAGAHSTTLRIAETGRYRVAVQSPSGMRLRLVSRLTGPGAWSGQAGVSDGSIDQFLDAGEYRVDTQGHAQALGNATLALARFDELQPEQPTLALGLASTSLHDLQQRTYTLHVTEPGPLFIEAAGRALGGLALRNAQGWLLHRVDDTVQRMPVPGEPMRVATLVRTLAAGRYQLSVFGAKPLPWAHSADAAPLHLRHGITVLAPDHHGKQVVSPFGVDRFLVPAFASFVRLELPVAMTASLAAQPFDGRTIFDAAAQRGVIEPRQRVPVVHIGLPWHGTARLDTLAQSHFGALPVDTELRRFWRPLTIAKRKSARYNLITVAMAAGHSYSLQFANDERRVELGRAGRYFVEASAAGEVRDAPSLTALAFAGPKREARHKLVSASAIELRSTTSLRSQFNLNTSTELYVRVREAGSYRLFGTGLEATYELQPYGARDNTAKRTFPSSASEPIVLERGFFRLRVSAPSPGTHLMTLQGAAANQGTFTRLASAAQFADLEVASGHEVIVTVAAAAPALNLSVRRLPVDLRVPMQVILEPGQALTLPVRMSSTARVHLQHDGPAGDIAFEHAGRRSDTDLQLPAGEQSLRVISHDVVPRRIALVLAGPQQDSYAPELPVTPSLSGDVPVLLELAREVPQQVWLDVPRAGLINIETRGLLATAATLSAPSVLDIATGNDNGTGRNMRLVRWLPEGRWRLEVHTTGRSAGRAQLQLQPVQILERGVLLPGIALARAMRSDESWPVQLHIEHPGRYRLRAMTPTGPLPVELRDAQGWPVHRPGTVLAEPMMLAAGRYALQVHAPRTPGNVVLELDALAEAPMYVGHGPHRIAPGAVVEHRWHDDGADRWQFRVPAEVSIQIDVSNGMTGVLQLPDGARAELGNEPLVLDARPGEYELRLRHARDSNRTDYRLRVVADALLPGQSRTVKLPATLDVAVAPTGLVHLRTTGNRDVRAELEDANGRLLAHSDDTGANWNIDLRVKTATRKARLTLRPVGESSATTLVHYVDTAHSLRASNTFVASDSPKPSTVLLPADVATLLSVPDDGDVAAHGLRPARVGRYLMFANAQVSRTVDVPAGAEVDRRSFPTAAATLDGGKVHVPAGQAVRVPVDATLTRVTLDLPGGMYALLDEDTVGADRPARWTVDTTASSLYLFNTVKAGREAAVHLEALEPGAGHAALSAHVPGRWRPAPHWQQLHGNGARLVVTGSAGWQGRGLEPGPIEIEYTRGWTRLWNLTAAQSVAAAGRAATISEFEPGLTLRAARTLALPATNNALYELRTNAPLAWFVRRAGLTRSGVLRGGTMLLTPGRAGVDDADELHVVPLHDAATVQMARRTPAPVKEGLSTRSWLSANGDAAFTFELTQARRVGLGVKGEHAAVGLRLLREGRHLPVARDRRASPLPTMLELDLAAGTYMLVATNLSSTPQAIRVALTGTQPPAGLPGDVVRRYLSEYQP